jgi:DNA-binding winged helix-turn-helix (wHTH) protein
LAIQTAKQLGTNMATTSKPNNPGNGWIYRCDDLVIEPRAHRLERDGRPLQVEPKAYAVLLALLQQAGTVIDRNTLLDTAWGHRNVTPGVLSRVISQLRHALDDSPAQPRYIATVNCLGYRFIGKVYRQVAPPAVQTLPASANNSAELGKRAAPGPPDSRRG